MEHKTPTRREYMKYGGAVIGGGLLAGCTGSSSGDGVNSSNNSGSGAAGEQFWRERDDW